MIREIDAACLDDLNHGVPARDWRSAPIVWRIDQSPPRRLRAVGAFHRRTASRAPIGARGSGKRKSRRAGYAVVAASVGGGGGDSRADRATAIAGRLQYLPDINHAMVIPNCR